MESFTAIDNDILDRIIKELNISELKVYLVLCKYSYGNKTECYPTEETIKDLTGMCKRTIAYAIKGLLNKNYIWIEKHKRNNIYHLTDKNISYKIIDTDETESYVTVEKVIPEEKSEKENNPYNNMSVTELRIECNNLTNKSLSLMDNEKAYDVVCRKINMIKDLISTRKEDEE